MYLGGSLYFNEVFFCFLFIILLNFSNHYFFSKHLFFLSLARIILIFYQNFNSCNIIWSEYLRNIRSNWISYLIEDAEFSFWFFNQIIGKLFPFFFSKRWNSSCLAPKKRSKKLKWTHFWVFSFHRRVIEKIWPIVLVLVSFERIRKKIHVNWYCHTKETTLLMGGDLLAKTL